MKSSDNELKRRGFVSQEMVQAYLRLEPKAPLEDLQSSKATKRTLAAIAIQHTCDKSALNDLLEALCKEKALYTKIAISQALASLGPDIVPACVPYLGKIGHNQHRSLPLKPFLKSSYPLPRDLIARTLTLGTRAFIAPLIQGLQQAKPQTLLEGIDALGHLSYYKKSEEAEAFILALFKTYAHDELIIWKLIQACQAFSSEAIEYHLQILLKSSCQAHAVEAKRVLELRKKLRA